MQMQHNHHYHLVTIRTSYYNFSLGVLCMPLVFTNAEAQQVYSDRHKKIECTNQKEKSSNETEY